MIPPQFDRVLRGFSEGLATVVVGKKFGFVDLSGKYVAEPQFDQAGWFSDGRAPVKLGAKWGFIDKTGAMVVPPTFDEVTPFFSEGMIAVKVGDKWGFSDPMGNLVIPAKFDGPTESVPFLWFSDGLAPVRVGLNWGFIDRMGKTVIEPRLDLGWPFTNGLAVAIIDRTEFYIDKTGNPVRQINNSPFTVPNAPVPPGTSLDEIILGGATQKFAPDRSGGRERLVFASMSEKLLRSC